MKKMKFALTVLLVFVLGIAAVSSAALPGNHEEYMKNESYKAAFDRFALGMEEAEDRLTPDEYEVLEKEGEEVIAASVKEDMERGASEADAYETAYWMRYEQVSTELHRDWLRKNAEDAQGFYRLKSDAFDGYMTLEKGDEDGLYAVKIFVTMEREPHNTGEIYGPGKFSGDPRDARTSPREARTGKMTVSHFDDDSAVTITFDGETAKVETTEALKYGGWFGAGVTIDGEYVREKK